MNNYQVKILFFGSFRQFGDYINLTVMPNCSIWDIKKLLVEKIGENQQDLINASVLADDVSILRDSDVIIKPTKLSILPPVCGG